MPGPIISTWWGWWGRTEVAESKNDETRTQMKIKLTALAAVLLLAALAGCTGKEKAKASSAHHRGAAFKVDSAVLVETAEATKGPFSVRGDYAGEFAAERQAEVAFEVPGRIVKMDYDIGDRLAKGHVLAKIGQTTYRQKVREAQAAVEMAQASLGQAKVAAANLEADYKAKKPLLKKQLISQREVENLDAQLRQARQKVAVAQASLEQAKARLQTARENLRNTEVRAPFDAKIAARQADLGSYVGPSQPVFRLVSDAQIFLKVNVPEQDSGSVGVGKPVTVRVGALGGVSFDGKVARVAPAIDPGTRTLRADVVLAPTDEQKKLVDRIRPGMYAQVQVQLGQRDQAVTVPKQALQEERGGEPFVWILTDDGEAKKAPLTLGLKGRDRVEVLAGLDGGEKVVIRGFEKLEVGSKAKSLATLAK